MSKIQVIALKNLRSETVSLGLGPALENYPDKILKKSTKKGMNPRIEDRI